LNLSQQQYFSLSIVAVPHVHFVLHAVLCTVVGAGVDFSLIPRALQAEEELLTCIHEFRSLEYAATTYIL
jgi:hypothetical protein